MNSFKSAQIFIREHDLQKNYSYSDLKDIADKYGYELYEWLVNDHDDLIILQSLDCQDTSLHSDGFTYNSETKKIIFIKKTLTEKEKKIALMHELIHIFSGHIDINRKINITEEKQTTDIHRSIDLLLKHKNIFRFALLAQAISFTTLLTLIIILLVAAPEIKAQINLSDYVYVTPTGHSYHTQNCTYGGEYENAFKILRSDAVNHYLPCSQCNADKY